jgi:nucleoid-associated protein YgaU
MDLRQLTIVIEKDGSTLQFDPSCKTLVAQYNPSKMGFNRTVGWQNQQATGKDVPEMQFTGSEPSTLSIDLFFDTYDSPRKETDKESVRKYTEKLRHLTTVEQHGKIHRPPVCQLKWAADGPFFQGVLNSLDIQYTLFTSNGIPVRATCRCSFKEWRPGLQDLRQQDLLSADVAKVWVVKQGQTLSTIAAQEYGDPREWRAIAEANELDDPLALAPGVQLLLPARRERL